VAENREAVQAVKENRAVQDEAVRKAGEKAREEVLASSDDAILNDIAVAILLLRGMRQ